MLLGGIARDSAAGGSAVLTLGGVISLANDAGNRRGWVLVAVGLTVLAWCYLSARIELHRTRITPLPGDGGPAWRIEASKHDEKSLLIFLFCLRDQHTSDLSCTVEAPNGVCTTAKSDASMTARLHSAQHTAAGFEYPQDFPGADQTLVSGRYAIEFRGILAGTMHPQPLARGALAL